MTFKHFHILIGLAGFIFPAGLYSQIIQVRQDGTGDAVTIQQGVDMSKDGDTVLVWPGIYTENVVCDHKNITLASRVLTTGDLSYKYETVIDGNFGGGCLKIKDCLTGITVCGFTLQHGSGSYFGGLSGGGILTDYGKLYLKHTVARDNKVTGSGGGMYFNHSEVFMSDVTICHNYAYIHGGGMLIVSSPVVFDSVDRCNIYHNYSARGTEILKSALDDSLFLIVDTFTVAAPDYYYLYSEQLNGFPRGDITYDIQTPWIESVNQDLYVAPWGDNANSGFSPSEPLKQISFALLKMQSDSLSPDTIHLATGVYSLEEGQQFPLNLKAYVSIRGAGRDSTILDGSNEIHLLEGYTNASHYQVSDLTVRNGNGDLYSVEAFGGFDILYNRHASFTNLKFVENKGHVCSAGAIHNSNDFTITDVEFSGNFGGKALRMSHGHYGVIYYDTGRVYNCRFFNNQPEYEDPWEGFGGSMGSIGQGSHPDLMTVYIYNSLFHENLTKEGPFSGAVANSIGIIYQSRVNVVNCTFGYNSSENPEGANIGVTYDSDMKVYNSIMYGNYPAEFYMYAFDGDDCSLSIYNSLVSGGEDEIRILSPWNELYYAPTNIDTDPLWDTASPWPYSLMDGSPCIDAGTLDLPPDIELPEYDLAGNPRVWGESVDMGAYEYGPWVGVPSEPSSRIQVPGSKLLEISPNPFSYGTYIGYELQSSGWLNISVYRLSGMKVRTLENHSASKGDSGKFYWDGSDQDGNKLPAGVYLIRMTVDGKEVETVKVVKE